MVNCSLIAQPWLPGAPSSGQKKICRQHGPVCTVGITPDSLYHSTGWSMLCALLLPDQSALSCSLLPDLVMTQRRPAVIFQVCVGPVVAMSQRSFWKAWWQWWRLVDLTPSPWKSKKNSFIFTALCYADLWLTSVMVFWLSHLKVLPHDCWCCHLWGILQILLSDLLLF